jgi:hypothetical protein
VASVTRTRSRMDNGVMETPESKRWRERTPPGMPGRVHARPKGRRRPFLLTHMETASMRFNPLDTSEGVRPRCLPRSVVMQDALPRQRGHMPCRSPMIKMSWNLCDGVTALRWCIQPSGLAQYFVGAKRTSTFQYWICVPAMSCKRPAVRPGSTSCTQSRTLSALCEAAVEWLLGGCILNNIHSIEFTETVPDAEPSVIFVS